MEYGAYSLQEFFEIRVPPADPLGIYLFWKEIQCLISALNKIHNLQIRESGERFYYWG
jgi:hypothetical protein